MLENPRNWLLGHVLTASKGRALPRGTQDPQLRSTRHRGPGMRLRLSRETQGPGPGWPEGAGIGHAGEVGGELGRRLGWGEGVKVRRMARKRYTLGLRGSGLRGSRLHPPVLTWLVGVIMCTRRLMSPRMPVRVCRVFQLTRITLGGGR